MAKKKRECQLELETNLNESILVINIESLNINMIFSIFHKPNGYNSKNLINKMADNQQQKMWNLLFTEIKQYQVLPENRLGPHQ